MAVYSCYNRHGMMELLPAIADVRALNTYICTFDGYKLCFSLCVLDYLPGFLSFQYLASLLSNYNNN